MLTDAALRKETAKKILRFRTLAGVALAALALSQVPLRAPAQAETPVQRMTARLASEADAFRILAPQVIGQETLHQKALKKARRFGIRIGDAARQAPKPVWQEREVVSEYGFGIVGDSFHELRQVVSVDGRKVGEPKKAQEALMQIILADNEGKKRQIMKQFEKYGLLGAVTDFGPLILLFTPEDILHYEFTESGESELNGVPVRVFRYRQIDGEEAVTLVEEKKDEETVNFQARGEVWVRANDYEPVRITLGFSKGDGEEAVREEAVVDYVMTQHGALMPVSTRHQELRAGMVVAENTFAYSEFQRFAASSDIKFEAEPDPPSNDQR